MIGNEEFVQRALPAVVRIGRVSDRQRAASITGATARNNAGSGDYAEALRGDLERLVKAWDEASPALEEIRALLDGHE